jgi:hypothetical protein
MSNPLKYMLRGREVITTESLDEWQEFMSVRNRIITQNQVGTASVSTTFLGLDFGQDPAKPLVFETMVFGGPMQGAVTRCSTYDEAEEQHRAMCRAVTTNTVKS